MAGIGETLKLTREKSGISLDQAEEETKIRKRYLQALEDEEYDIIPGTVYARGFLKNYANYLGLNSEEILIEYKLLNLNQKEESELKEEKPDIAAAITKTRAARRMNKKIYRLTVVVAAASILVFALYSMISASMGDHKEKIGKSDNGIQQSEQNKQAKQENEEKSKNSQQNSGENKMNTTPEGSSTNQQGNIPPVQNDDKGIKTSGPVTIVLSAKDQSCWVKVSADNHTVYTGNIEPGIAKTFNASKKIKFRLGNAGAVDVTVNGQSLGTLGTFGQVIDKEVSSSS